MEAKNPEKIPVHPFPGYTINLYPQDNSVYVGLEEVLTELGYDADVANQIRSIDETVYLCINLLEINNCNKMQVAARCLLRALANLNPNAIVERVKGAKNHDKILEKATCTPLDKADFGPGIFPRELSVIVDEKQLLAYFLVKRISGTKAYSVPLLRDCAGKLSLKPGVAVTARIGKHGRKLHVCPVSLHSRLAVYTDDLRVHFIRTSTPGNKPVRDLHSLFVVTND